MDNKEIKTILYKHKLWVHGDTKGERADLRGANLLGANLLGVDLREANLQGANLYRSDLQGADLREANLYRSDLQGANLLGADLRGAIINYPISCPEEGSFIAFKKVQNYLIKLEIPAEAKRCSATSRKCRCEFAKVLSITDLSDGDETITMVTNTNYETCIYTVGEIVYPDKFNEDRWNECSHGIHFFITRDEAVNYFN